MLLPHALQETLLLLAHLSNRLLRRLHLDVRAARPRQRRCERSDVAKHVNDEEDKIFLQATKKALFLRQNICDAWMRSSKTALPKAGVLHPPR